SIGGKVAVDHPMGKNLVGSFYQPELVLADVQLLTTLPRRELTAGWVETIKHGLILDADLFRFMDVQADALLSLDPQFVERAVVWSATVKAWVVSEDERETGGRRTLLNYGHTIGHGIEAATGFERFLHGEAIAIGMMGAASLSQRLGLIDAEVVEEQRRVLEKFCLPVTCYDVDRDAVLKAMQLDKKVKDKAIRWVLLDELGEAVVRSDVSVTDVADVLGELGVG
ncbi:MAG: 3-dehydroquinate synthase family protein, partial [Dehalococcoidia bacterium]|nr:3-dehydroquinate synthase family protein [Dehalococcoidia bacterium]